MFTMRIEENQKNCWQTVEQSRVEYFYNTLVLERTFILFLNLGIYMCLPEQLGSRLKYTLKKKVFMYGRSSTIMTINTKSKCTIYTPASTQKEKELACQICSLQILCCNLDTTCKLPILNSLFQICNTPTIYK